MSCSTNKKDNDKVRNHILHAQALSDVKATSIAGKELATMGESDQDKVAANLTTNLQKKVNKVIDLIQLRKSNATWLIPVVSSFW